MSPTPVPNPALLLSDCIARFGPAPRSFSWWDRLTYLRIPTPQWVSGNPDEALATFFERAPSTLRDGTVVWGVIVQANTLLFEPGDIDCPAEVVFSLAPAEKAPRSELRRIAAALFELKGTRPRDPGELRIAEHLTNELTRVFGLEVPSSISPTIPCQLSTLMVTRKHLPDGYLRSTYLPVVISPDDPRLAVPLPSRYWPAPLAASW
ncbi:MAG: hypothetical protein U0230_18505 [Polyangiales bacterium]